MTTEHDRELLLTLAREALAAHVGVSAAHVPGPAEILERGGGAVGTRAKDGELRGCIGHIEPNEPLGAIVPRCAVAAGTTDPRFPPITPSELNHLDIEISLLGRLALISGAQDIEVGRHGLVVAIGWQGGLLLPQVAPEWKWDAE